MNHSNRETGNWYYPTDYNHVIKIYKCCIHDCKMHYMTNEHVMKLIRCWQTVVSETYLSLKVQNASFVHQLIACQLCLSTLASLKTAACCSWKEVDGERLEWIRTITVRESCWKESRKNSVRDYFTSLKVWIVTSLTRGSLCLTSLSPSVPQDLEIVYSYLHGMEALSNLREHQLRSVSAHISGA